MTNRTPIALYVDHDLDQRILVAAILEARGLSVRTAKSALNALELVSTEGFDVVMIYYKLPDMTGSQLAEEIRAVKPSVRIILLSGQPRLPAGGLAYVDVHIVNRSLLDIAFEFIGDLLQSPNLTPEPAT
jgi:CheY-like chemotaxis protein